MRDCWALMYAHVILYVETYIILHVLYTCDIYMCYIIRVTTCVILYVCYIRFVIAFLFGCLNGSRGNPIACFNDLALL